MAKKRTSLDALFETEQAETISIIKEEIPQIIEENKSKNKTEKVLEKQNQIIKQTVYLPIQVHEQLRLLAFEERKKMHDYLVEGLDRVFKNRGLKTFTELTK